MVHEAGHPKLALWDTPEGRVRVGREVGAGFRNGGTQCLWPIHVEVWQKPSPYCKVIILQLKLVKKIKT